MCLSGLPSGNHIVRPAIGIPQFSDISGMAVLPLFDGRADQGKCLRMRGASASTGREGYACQDEYAMILTASSVRDPGVAATLLKKSLQYCALWQLCALPGMPERSPSVSTPTPRKLAGPQRAAIDPARLAGQRPRAEKSQK